MALKIVSSKQPRPLIRNNGVFETGVFYWGPMDLKKKNENWRSGDDGRAFSWDGERGEEQGGGGRGMESG